MTSIHLKIPKNQLQALREVIEKSGLQVEFQDTEKQEENWVQFASEETLAQDWDTEEDAEYEKYFKQ